jgi:hypothetical protein
MVPAAIFAAFLCLQTSPTPAPATPPAENKLDTDLAAKIADRLPLGEHQDIPWKVKVQKPIFTFQQRNVVKVTAEIDVRVLQEKSVKRRLVFVLKVADEQGGWLPGENYVFQDFEKPIGSSSEREFASEVLLRPGKYTIAAILYDAVLNEYDLSLQSIVVDALKKDPLPDLFNNAPPAELVRGEVYGEEAFSPLRPELLLHNKRPLQIDLIVDMSSREHQVTLAPPPVFMPRGGMPRPSRFKRLEDKTYTIHLLQTASILGSLRPQAGCLRVSSLDVFKKQLFEPTLADQLDWRKLYAQQVESTKNTISVNALESRKDLPKYFVEAFDSFTKDAHCDSGSIEHIVVVLSHGLHFPENSQKVKLEDCACKVFYLRQNDTAMDSDDLKRMLSPLSPQELEFHDPMQFRKRLADLIEHIEKLTQ